MANELAIPEAAERDNNSIELMRCWAAENKQHISLRIGCWEQQGVDERQAWGLCLADIIHHIANAHHDAYGRDKEETVAIICEALNVELDHSTSDRVGNFEIEE